MNPELLVASDHALAAAGNALYQGLLLTVLVGAGLRLGPATNAATRHAVWFVTLLLLASLVPAQWCRDYLLSGWAKHLPADRNAATLEREALSPGAVNAEPIVVGVNEMIEGHSTPGPADQVRSAEAAPADSNGLVIPQTLEGARLASLTQAGVAEGNSPRPRRARFFEPVAWKLVSASRAAQIGGLALLAAWLIGAGVRVGRLLLQLRQIYLLKKYALPASEELNGIFERQRSSLGVTRKVGLKVSRQPGSPLLLGFFQPMILLPRPVFLEIDSEQAAQIMVHELAHVRRRDDWATLIQQLVQAALFFHPAVWWISRQLSLEREIASDDLVLRQGRPPRAYALLLLHLASRLNLSPPLLAPGVSTSKSQLQQRITMILDTHRSTSPRLAKAKLGFFTLASTGAAIIALCLGPRLVLAHNDSTDPSAVSDDNSARKAEVTIATTRPELSVKTDVKTAIRPEVSIQTDLTLTDAQGVDLAKSQESNSPDEPGADTGPKFKPNLPLPAEPRLPAPPVPARKPRPPGAVQLPGVPPVKPLGGSLEERLDRLERMVEALMAEQGPKRLRAERQMAELDQQKQMLNQQQLDELKMLAKKGDVRAAEEAKRAAKEMEKARKLERMKRDNGQWPEGFQNQIKALQKQREGLQRELEKLEHQIERLEQQQERIQEKQERHRHDHDKDSESEEPESKTGDR